MSEKEKSTTDGILSAIDKLTESRGPEFVEGLITGIGIGTTPNPDTTEQGV